MTKLASSPQTGPLRMLWPYLQPYRWWVLWALVAMGIAAAATLTLPAAARLMIDSGFDADAAGRIDVYFLLLFIVACVMGWAAALRFFLVSKIGERVVADLRSALFRHLLRLSPSFYENTRAGEISSRLTTDTSLVQTAVGSSVSVALRSSIMLIGSCVLLAITDPRLAAISALVIPLVMVPIIGFGRKVRRLSRASQDRIADTAAIATETVAAMTVVQSYAQEGATGNRFSKAVESAWEVALGRIRARAWLTALVITLVFGAVVLVLWLGAKAVIAGSMTAGELGQFVLYAVLAASSAGALSEVWGDVQRAAGAMERIGELLSTSPEIVDVPGAVTLPERARGELSIRDLTFAYPTAPDTPALRNIDLHVASGQTVALVGPSGAGKSTLFQLILRFYQPQQGTICLDGQPIEKLSLASLRDQIALVPQDTVVFSASAKENIAFARPDASAEEVEHAARAAQALNFIDRLGQGFDTHLGERGVRLSGGQRQRLAIARAILKNPPLLLLDEATSALDARSEKKVQQALDQLLINRTTLVIAHRLATVRGADHILVLDRGCVVGQGSHEQLMREDGLYRSLARMQFGQDETGS